MWTLTLDLSYIRFGLTSVTIVCKVIASSVKSLHVIRQGCSVINEDMDNAGLMNSGCNVSHKNCPVIQHAANIG